MNRCQKRFVLYNMECPPYNCKLLWSVFLWSKNILVHNELFPLDLIVILIEYIKILAET